MTIKVNESIDSDTAERVSIIRQSKGTYEDGIFVEGDNIKIKALASIQPATGKQMSILPEGERTSDTQAIFINKRVYGSGKEGQVADKIEHKGLRYKIKKVADWSSYGYNMALGVIDG